MQSPNQLRICFTAVSVDWTKHGYSARHRQGGRKGGGRGGEKGEEELTRGSKMLGEETVGSVDALFKISLGLGRSDGQRQDEGQRQE